MKWHNLLMLLIAALAAVAITGCNGPSPTLHPQVKFTFDETVSWPYFSAGSLLTIRGEANPPISTENPLYKAQWHESPDIGGQFLMSGTQTLENSWRAPLVDKLTPVDLVLDMATAQGGEATVKIHLIVVPIDQLPVYDFYTDEMAEQITTFPTVTSGASLTIAGTGTVDGDPDKVVRYKWTPTSSTAGKTGAFSSNTAKNPTWTAPILAAGAEPVQVQLNVEMTTDQGVTDTSSLVVTVTPP